MKKFLPYILILIVLFGLFHSKMLVMATEPLGDCVISVPKGQEGPPQVLSDQTKGQCSGPNMVWSPYYHFLAPLPEMPADFKPASNDALGTYLNTMIKLFIGICAVLAVIMIVMGGIEYMTSELISNKEEGKRRITNAIFGLLLALGAWTLLNTINPDLLKSDLGGMASVEIGEKDDGVSQTPNAEGKYPNSPYKKDAPWDDSIGAIIENIPGVMVKTLKECTKVGEPKGCLSTRNLSLNNINEVKDKCPKALPLKLNGGTEFWHHGGLSGNTTHGPGSPTIDLQSSSELNICLSGGQTPKINTMYGGKYYYEGGHWHIGLGK